jgi:hypothetical protein
MRDARRPGSETMKTVSKWTGEAVAGGLAHPEISAVNALLPPVNRQPRTLFSGPRIRRPGSALDARSSTAI